MHAHQNDSALADALVEPLLTASAAILSVRAGDFTVERKADSSPVTEADRRAEAIILEALSRVAPEIPVIAEEAIAAGRLPAILGTEYFLVDPLDGTKEFVKGGDDFTVNIGLVRNGVPVLGLVSAPARSRAWLGCPGNGARVFDFANPDDRQSVSVRKPRANAVEILTSRSHMEAATKMFVERFPGARLKALGSSIKFCLIAEGLADLYPRLGPTSQWDTAAGDAILRSAGGRTLNIDGSEFRYTPQAGEGAEAFLNPSFVATAGLDPFKAAA